MNTLELLDELQRKALQDADVREALLKTREEENPLGAFCRRCRDLGYEIYEMELVNAGEEFYAEMKRSTNGGGENSPMLEGEDDFYEMFFASLETATPKQPAQTRVTNPNKGGNMLRSVFYVCPICGNILHSTGECMVSCCGEKLTPLSAEKEDDEHRISVEQIETDSYITLEHEMSKEHYISFLANVTSSKAELVKLYPEQNAEVRMMLRGHGILYAYCNKHGLIKKRY